MSTVMRNGLTAILIAAALTGCADGQNRDQEPKATIDSKLLFEINLDDEVTTKVTHRETGESVSIDDSCQTYNQSSPETEKLFDVVACTHVGVLIGMTEAGNQPPVPDGLQCGLPIAPEIPSGMKHSMDTYCELNPALPMRNALDIYWDDSITVSYTHLTLPTN